MSFHLFELLRFAGSAIGLPAVVLGAGGWVAAQAPEVLPTPPMVMIPAGSLDLAQAGEFLRDGRPAVAPVAHVRFERGVDIMAYQVSLADYGRCVKAGACKPSEATGSAEQQVPATGVSFLDAQAYAAWYSQQTGENWRLPTDAEWAYAAAERFTGDLDVGAEDPANPASAWIRRYRTEAELRRVPDPQPKAVGSYGANSRGIFDLSGNVWEWTSTCYSRVTLAAGSKPAHTLENCGVHVVEGRHRAYMSNFIRDGKSGGCALGALPDNLGFRLVRDAAPAVPSG